MGNPLRFFGRGEPIDDDDFTLPPRCAVEVTFRAHQQRHLMRPDHEVTQILLGCIGRAYNRYPTLSLHVLSVLSNHGCFVASPESPAVLSSFMRDFLSTAATRLNVERRRRGTFWERRYRAIPIADEQALDNRFAYTLLQGTKENLVINARDWPGVSSIDALTGGRLIGRWRDNATEYERNRQLKRKQARAIASGRPVPTGQVDQAWIHYPIELHPLPHWKRWTETQRRARVDRLVEEDADHTSRRHASAGTRPVGRDAIAATDPESRPATPKTSPAPRVHASTQRARVAYLEAYREFVAAARRATERLEQATADLDIPADITIPPVAVVQGVPATALDCRQPRVPRQPNAPPSNL